MECNKDGQEKILPSAISRCKVERKRRAGNEGRLQLAFTTSVPYLLPTQPMHFNQVSHHTSNLPATVTHAKDIHPFMSNMDEITYWVFTKRAPCLLNYDNLMKSKNELAHCSKVAPISIHSDKPAPKKKRKIEMLDVNSISSEKQQNVFFATPQHPNDKAGKVSCSSQSQGSDVDFNVRDSTNRRKSKLQKKGKVIKKKNKVVTSTPKTTNLRRSLRNTQQNNSHLNNSLDIFDTNFINGNQDREIKLSENNNKEHVIDEKNEVQVNGQFEDISDVSGFTANYIRSTKIHSSKQTPKSRNKSRALKGSANQEKEKIVMCVNKSMNTDVPNAILNCSTDSSQNIVNLVTVKNAEQSNKVDKSTSLLKFIDPKIEKSKRTSKSRSRNNLNVSFHSKSSKVSRYPKRQQVLRNSKTYNHREDLESSEKKISRTRSGRKIGFDSDETGCSVVQINSTEISTSVAVNVADGTKKRKRNTSKCHKKNKSKGQDSFSDMSDVKVIESQDSLVKRLTRGQSRKSLNKRQSSQRDSLRDKSGFAACFSDSDSDDEPLKQRKFFC